MIPVTYYPVATQEAMARNAERVVGKPYARFFRTQMWLHEDVLPALRAPMDPRDAITTNPEDLNSLLDPGYHAVENGYCQLGDGSAYVASLTRFPGCTSAMLRWWFWWHSFESERYTLWYPWNHVSVRRDDPETACLPGLSDEQRYVGSRHVITEFIGPDRMDIVITFIDPAKWGFDTARFPAAGVSAHACGDVHLQRLGLRAGTMVHLARDTTDGFELRSRYWLADRTELTLAGRTLNLDRAAAALGVKARLAGARVGYEQLLHDQIEFTHLAGFLADAYTEFGSID